MALKELIVTNAVAIVVIGSLVLFAIIMIVMYVSTPTPAPPIAFTHVLQSAGVILVVSGPLVFVLEIRKSQDRRNQKLV